MLLETKDSPQVEAAEPALPKSEKSTPDDFPQVEGVELSKVGLGAAKGMSDELWSEALRKIAPIEGGSPWWVGDLLVLQPKRYGETFAAAQELTGYKVQRLKDLKYVASKVPAAVREPSLSIWVHKVVATMHPAEQELWLKHAAEEGWTAKSLRDEVEEFREEMKQRRQGGGQDESFPGGEYRPPTPLEQANRCTEAVLDAIAQLRAIDAGGWPQSSEVIEAKIRQLRDLCDAKLAEFGQERP